MAEITVIPVGVGTSVSRYITECVKVIRKYKLKHKVTPTSTIIEGDVKTVFDVLREMHEKPFEFGVKRVVTVIKIDDRRDKDVTMNYKLERILEMMK